MPDIIARIDSVLENSGDVKPSRAAHRHGAIAEAGGIGGGLVHDLPGVILEVWPQNPDHDVFNRLVWHLHSIVIPKGQRGQGVGTTVMTRLVNAADKAGAIVTLDPSTDFGATSTARLRQFYSRFGFRRNHGRYADLSLSGAMFRKPKGKA